MIEKRRIVFAVSAGIFLAVLCGCSHNTDTTDAQGKPAFKAGPGIPADVIAKMNAAKASQAGQPK